MVKGIAKVWYYAWINWYMYRPNLASLNTLSNQDAAITELVIFLFTRVLCDIIILPSSLIANESTFKRIYFPEICAASNLLRSRKLRMSWDTISVCMLIYIGIYNIKFHSLDDASQKFIQFFRPCYVICSAPMGHWCDSGLTYLKS